MKVRSSTTLDFDFSEVDKTRKLPSTTLGETLEEVSAQHIKHDDA